MSLNIDEIRSLMTDLENSSLREFKINDGDFSLHLSKNDQATIVNTPAAPVQTQVQEPSTISEIEEHPLAKPVKVGTEIVAPMVGTVYLQPKPDAPMFKAVGDKVSVGETVAVIEAMKLMTEIHSDVAGTVSEILVENEEVVDYNKPLYVIISD
ncbi:MAG: acetyl-CoA carboxylase biotin carboxyl carrier protein [Leuconostoc gelidum]|mgnify:FL=1|jgi:acetyl-CoA carboxylase biotin carboxyl carrier protein|uniref:acetyl-CoA carboxylase biotin carboxyl carrier protein n=1 Tax=Leuconostoc gelidum TaxID=1244 RepID=UPI0002191D6D|nr:acetyl-CoA carboxylase biotin carboxyl carrier protein [Leuconostoc gelidum]AFS40931.1 acetyl-CoA carboxylase, biotin carboxyl carrier protein [Leuconostoc gelidum JB7]MBZ5979010.1 acetyl-CoA carboxylase biotin carboxyl carrier protein [Leuconostoc gelidum subsp. gelidum]MBZ5992982.1 acetyl-CoA carboxylase biotin carboxyl carrier protein [Leuconostoc gelidum subsp. gelidum]MBZ6000708.1 acetyl-CoA carboxylase biotin carboxyl carrier protein [Leuconostoc gelidum subsp. gelidum]MBZ6009574.1 ac